MFGGYFLNTTLTLIACSLVLIYFYVNYVYSYWRRRGVPFLTPSFPFGNFGKNFMQKLSLGEQIEEIYRSTSDNFIGIFGVLRPTLIVRDPVLIRNVLIKDFQHFTDRGVYVDLENDPLSGHLFSLEGDRWKNLRSKLTPTFTTGKMKAIFSSLLECKNPLQQHISKLANANETVEVCELIARFTTNVIASVAFGIETDCLADPNNPFRKNGRKFFASNLKNAFRFFCFTVYPTLLKWSGIHLMDRDVEEFFFDMVKQTLQLRENECVVRKDFFQLLVQLRNTGSVQMDDEFKTIISNENSKTLTFDELSAQVFVFYVAGFETSSTTMAFCLYEIAQNPDIQRKIHEEIDRVLEHRNGTFTYDSINGLKFLESCIDESLRKYPAVMVLSRVCTKEYDIPDSNVTIEKGTAIMIPVYGLHRDEKYYPDPEKFDPSRFFDENKNGKTICEMPYFPFGEGPRNCIGLRMGKMLTKVGIASMLQQHYVEIDERHIGNKLEFSAATFPLKPLHGIYLKFKSRTAN